MVILHGLFGSSSNWASYAKIFSERYFVILPDLRNHGRSPHANAMTYADLAEDVAMLLDELNLDDITLLGHSMGGKTAMYLALEQPERLRNLIVLDIAPVTFHDRFGPMVKGLIQLPLHQFRTRGEVEENLVPIIPDEAVRRFMMTNLKRVGHGFDWRVNMTGIAQHLADIMDFQEPPLALPHHGPCLFLYGTESNYVQPKDHERIFTLFPNASIEAVAGAGHWVQVDQPERFQAQFLNWLEHYGS